MKYSTVNTADVSPNPRDTRDTSKSINTTPRYIIHSSGLIALFVAVVTFWSTTYHKPLLLPIKFSFFLRANPKLSTLLWTTLGSLLAAFTLYLLNGLLLLMNKQVIATKGASLSDIDVWNMLHYNSFLIDFKRVKRTLLTLAFSITALYLSVAYTTLITPTQVLVTENLVGNELDFTSPDFWTWYNTFDNTGKPVRKVYGCTWWNYTSAAGEMVFHTCPGMGDPIVFISSGVSIGRSESGVSNSTIEVFNKMFNGSTGGVIPLGTAGISAFNTLSGSSTIYNTEYTNFAYNYTLQQQGLTADVSCKATKDSPIARTLGPLLGVNYAGGGNLRSQNFSLNIPNCNYRESAITASLASAAVFSCQPNKTVKEYTLYLSPFDGYAATALSFSNITCSITPKLTRASVTYRSSNQLFDVQNVQPILDSTFRIPNETVDAVKQIFSLAVTYWGNSVVDSILALRMTSKDISFTHALELMIRGIVEYEGTNMRVYYAANDAPGKAAVAGQFTVWRLGYNGQPIALASILPPFLFILVLGAVFTIMGLRTGTVRVSRFSPTRSTCLIEASAMGGHLGNLNIGKSGTLEADRASLVDVKMRFVAGQGFVDAAESSRGSVYEPYTT